MKLEQLLKAGWQITLKIESDILQLVNQSGTVVALFYTDSGAFYPAPIN